jgi:hypothetical protein
MKKIGIIFGQEDTFQWRLIDRINSMQRPGIVAEAVKIGGVVQGQPAGYALIFDRIAHDVPFYRSWLKQEVLYGTQVINDPFWGLADDKFFNNALALKLGVAVPRTVLLPHKDHPPRTNGQSMRNLMYPLPWEEIFSYVGFPAWLKQHYGGGWQHVYQVHSPEHLFEMYGKTGDHLMMLQEHVEFSAYYRCYCVGREHVRIMPYEPRNEHWQRYQAHHPPLAPALEERIRRDTLALCRGLGYDLNTLEFAIRDGVPLAIDFMNPVPDCEPRSVGEENFAWIIDRMSELLVSRVENPPPRASFRTWETQLAEGRFR